MLDGGCLRCGLSVQSLAELSAGLPSSSSPTPLTLPLRWDPFLTPSPSETPIQLRIGCALDHPFHSTNRTARHIAQASALRFSPLLSLCTLSCCLRRCLILTGRSSKGVCRWPMMRSVSRWLCCRMCECRSLMSSGWGLRWVRLCRLWRPPLLRCPPSLDATEQLKGTETAGCCASTSAWPSREGQR